MRHLPQRPKPCAANGSSSSSPTSKKPRWQMAGRQNKKHAPSNGAQCSKLGAILLCWNGSSLLPVTDVAGDRFLAQCRNGALYDNRFLAP